MVSSIKRGLIRDFNNPFVTYKEGPKGLSNFTLLSAYIRFEQIE